MTEKCMDLDVRFQVGEKIICIYVDARGEQKSSIGIINAIRCVLEITATNEQTYNMYRVNLGHDFSIWLPETALVYPNDVGSH